MTILGVVQNHIELLVVGARPRIQTIPPVTAFVLRAVKHAADWPDLFELSPIAVAQGSIRAAQREEVQLVEEAIRPHAERYAKRFHLEVHELTNESLVEQFRTIHTFDESKGELCQLVSRTVLRTAWRLAEERRRGGGPSRRNARGTAAKTTPGGGTGPPGRCNEMLAAAVGDQLLGTVRDAADLLSMVDADDYFTALLRRARECNLNPDVLREIVVGRIEGRELKEIAERLDMKENAAAQRLHRFRQVLFGGDAGGEKKEKSSPPRDAGGGGTQPDGVGCDGTSNSSEGDEP